MARPGWSRYRSSPPLDFKHGCFRRRATRSLRVEALKRPPAREDKAGEAAPPSRDPHGAVCSTARPKPHPVRDARSRLLHGTAGAVSRPGTPRSRLLARDRREQEHEAQDLEAGAPPRLSSPLRRAGRLCVQGADRVGGRGRPHHFSASGVTPETECMAQAVRGLRRIPRSCGDVQQRGRRMCRPGHADLRARRPRGRSLDSAQSRTMFARRRVARCAERRADTREFGTASPCSGRRNGGPS